MTSQMQVHLPTVLLLLARIYGSTVEALAQAVENAGDSCQTMRLEYGTEDRRVWVVLEPNRVIVTDTGHGMIPYMRQEDASTLEQYFAGKLELEGDVRDHLQTSSMRSLEWMMRCIALSAKVGLDDVRGMRGIGALAYLTYALKATVITRPCIALAREAGIKAKLVPTFILKPPSETDLGRGELAFWITETDEALQDPWGKKLPHGTTIIIEDIREGHITTLSNPLKVAGYFGARFGDDVRTNKYQLEVIDNVTTAGMRAHGKTIQVAPVRNLGRPLLSKELMLPDGHTFRVALFYRPDARAPSPMIRRRRSPVCRLTTIPELAGEPWSRLDGDVDFPDYPDDSRLWDTAKTTLMESLPRTMWIKALQELEGEIMDLLEEQGQEEKSTGRERLAEDLTAAAVEALREVPQFQPDLRGADRPKSQPRIKRRLEIVIATVVNEHGTPVPLVGIELWRGQQFIKRVATGLSGRVQFGRLNNGFYRLVIVGIPSGSKPLTPMEHEFIIKDTDNELAGCRVTFRLATGGPKPAPIPHKGAFEARFYAFDDPDRPWRGRLEIGVIEFNTIAPDLAAALESGDEKTQLVLLAQYTAAAMTQYFAEGDKEFILMQESILFGRILDKLTQRRESHRRQVRKRKKGK